MELKPAAQRRPVPPMPELPVGVVKLDDIAGAMGSRMHAFRCSLRAPPADSEVALAWNEAAYESYSRGTLVPCPVCKRTFNEERWRGRAALRPCSVSRRGVARAARAASRYTSAAADRNRACADPARSRASSLLSTPRADMHTGTRADTPDEPMRLTRPSAPLSTSQITKAHFVTSQCPRPPAPLWSRGRPQRCQELFEPGDGRAHTGVLR
jgi:hypothetical protein